MNKAQLIKKPTIVPPIQLEQIMYLRAGDNPRDLTTILDPEIRRAIQDAIDSFEPDNNTGEKKRIGGASIKTKALNVKYVATKEREALGK